MKVISFSLWGDNTRYTHGALQNASLALMVYPDWVCRYYIGKSCPSEVVRMLREFRNVEIVEMEEDGGSALGTMWRFAAASDPEVEVLLSRDCDSRLWFREKAAVDEWLASDKSFHIMRDNHQHTTPILAGMWGVRGDKLKAMRQLMVDYKGSDTWQVDQEFLAQVVYPIVQEDSVVHDPFFESKPFPYSRDENHFVGQAYAGTGQVLHLTDVYFQDYMRESINANIL